MNDVEETEDYTTRDMLTDIGKDVGKIFAAHAVAVGLLLAAGFTYSVVQDIKAKRAAKKAQTEE